MKSLQVSVSKRLNRRQWSSWQMMIRLHVCIRRCMTRMPLTSKIRVATTHHGQGTGAGGHRASDVGVQTRLDDFFHCRTGLGRQRTTEGRRCVIRKKRKCSKKSRKGRAKQRGSQILFRRSVQQKALNQMTAAQMTGTLLTT
ncbi:hypothetical protein ACQJBY_048232 [Aegilops geniculata]